LNNNILAVGGYGDIWLIVNQNITLVERGSLRGDKIDAIAWKSDGTQIAAVGTGQDSTGCLNNHINIWDVATGKLVKDIQIGCSIVGGLLAWKPNSNLLADTYVPDPYSTQDQSDINAEIAIWDVESGQIVSTIPFPDKTEIGSNVSWSPNGDRLAAGTSTLNIWDSNNLKLLFKYIPDQVINILRWNPDGERIAILDKTYGYQNSNTRQSQLEIIDTRTQYKLYTYTLSDQYIEAMAWSPDSKQIGLGGRSSHNDSTYFSIANIPDILNIKVTNDCVTSNAAVLSWDIDNLHSVDVPFTWTVDNSLQNGGGIAKAQSNTTFQTTPISGSANTVTIFVNGVLQDTATYDATQCPSITSTPTIAASTTSSATATNTQTPTVTPSITNTPSRTSTSTLTPTSTPTSTPSRTPTATLSPTVTLTPTPDCTSIAAHKTTIGVYRPSNHTFYLRNSNLALIPAPDPSVVTTLP
jgi:hypothetical protein